MGVPIAGPFVACPVHLRKVIHSRRVAARPKGGRVHFQRLRSSDVGTLGFKGARSGVVRAQGEEKERSQELDKVEDKPSESWIPSVQRANVRSKIFMAAFVWISLFFGISVANNEIGGGRPGRRRPRK